MTTTAPPTTTDLASEVFSHWLDTFGTALQRGEAGAVAEHFIEDGYWRDILSFTWDYRTFSGRAEIESAVRAAHGQVRPRELRLAHDRMAPRLLRRSARTVVEGYFDFDTEVGRGTGFVRLLLDADDPSASSVWILLTTLQELRGFEESVGARRPTGVEHSRDFAGSNWLDRRMESVGYTDRDPEVLIVGGGQAGLTLAARFTQIGVDALIVESNPRIGDNWRRRYHSLTLHNEVWANSMPYIPFPPTWPTFLPKDKLAGWLESYAELMELNIWTGTRFVDGRYDEADGAWAVQLQRADGAERTMRVPHLVLATGSISGIPKTPDIPGLGDFAGEVLHSTQFTTGKAYAGKRALVVGTGNSGHDVAQDLHANGAEVTIMQRRPTCVVSLEPSGTMVYALYSEGPVEDVDLITAALPYPLLEEVYQWMTKKTCELDKPLLDGLHAVGFETAFGDDGTGFHMKYLRQGGGYYINVGCSDLIADLQIALLHARDLKTFTTNGVQLTDSRSVPFDVVVLATGYEKQQEGVRRLLGPETAAKVGSVWGFNKDGFMRNMWTRTGQEHLWLMGGALTECRLFSRFLALMIKADLEGILPRRPQ